jgi:hypothetical protein
MMLDHNGDLGGPESPVAPVATMVCMPAVVLDGIVTRIEHEPFLSDVVLPRAGQFFGR